MEGGAGAGEVSLGFLKNIIKIKIILGGFAISSVFCSTISIYFEFSIIFDEFVCDFDFFPPMFFRGFCSFYF